MVNWQDLAALVAVAMAAAYLATLAWRRLARRKTAGCGGCSNCAASEPVNTHGISLTRRDQAAKVSENR